MSSMSDTRHKDVNWNLGSREQGVSYDMVKAAVLMDIRAELKQLNAILNCFQFLDIPRKLDAIKRNTTKKRRVKTQMSRCEETRKGIMTE